MKTKRHQIWDTLDLQHRETRHIKIGSLDLWVYKYDNELHISHSYVDDFQEKYSSEPVADKPEDKDWKSWIFSDNTSRISMIPALPDRPVVTRPELPIFLPSHQSIQLYVSIPCFVQFKLEKSGKIIYEVPSTILSNTWFGTPVEGELCYSLHTTPKQNVEELRQHYYRIISPIQIINKSDDIFEVQRLCINVKYQNIYQGELRMWANGGRISYLGENNWSQITYVKNPPDMDGDKLILADARNVADKNIFFKTFDTFKPLQYFNM